VGPYLAGPYLAKAKLAFGQLGPKFGQENIGPQLKLVKVKNLKIIDPQHSNSSFEQKYTPTDCFSAILPTGRPLHYYYT